MYLPPGVYSEELHGREDQNINGGQDKTSFQDSKSDIARILIHVGLQSQTTKIEQNSDLHKECTEELTRTVRENEQKKKKNLHVLNRQLFNIHVLILYSVVISIYS